MLKRVVGNQSVMLHALKEKVDSMVAMADLDDMPVKAWEILAGLREWSSECDDLMKSEAEKLRASSNPNAESDNSG